ANRQVGHSGSGQIRQKADIANLEGNQAEGYPTHKKNEQQIAKQRRYRGTLAADAWNQDDIQNEIRDACIDHKSRHRRGLAMNKQRRIEKNMDGVNQQPDNQNR